MINLIKASKFPLVSIKNDTICATKRYTDAVIGKAMCWVKIEHENQTASIQGYYLVNLLLDTDVSL